MARSPGKTLRTTADWLPGEPPPLPRSGDRECRATTSYIHSRKVMIPKLCFLAYVDSCKYCCTQERGRSSRSTAPAPASPATHPYSSVSDGLNLSRPALELFHCWGGHQLRGWHSQASFPAHRLGTDVQRSKVRNVSQ